jgi:hypothetical protein
VDAETIERLQRLEAAWEVLPLKKQQRIVHALVEGISISKDSFEIRLKLRGLQEVVKAPPAYLSPLKP